jgi:hypothetical protein
MEKRWLLIPVLALSAITGLGCGDDSSDKGAPDTGPAPMADAGKDSGTTPTPDAGGTGGMVAVAEPVPCGTMKCAQPASLLPGGMAPAGLPIMLPMPMACCFDPATSECGITMAAGSCNAIPVPDTTCPSIDLSGVAMFLMGMTGGFGCCTAEGQCGVDGAALGNGCIENGEAAAMLAASPLGALAGLIPIPPPQACGGGSDGGTDAGN